MNYTYNKFLGINRAIDSSLISEECVNITNADIRDGTLKCVKGLKPMEYSGLRGAKNLFSFYRYGTHDLLAFDDTRGALWRWEGTGWKHFIEGLNNYYDFDYANFNVNGADVIIFTNGKDNVKIYNGVFIKDLKMKGASSPEGVDNKAPKGSFCCIHYDRLWIADEHNVYCSSVTANGGIDIDDFTTPTEPESEVNQHGAQIFMYTDDGSKITGMKSIFDDILVFMDKRIFKLVGTTPSNLQKVEIFTAIGAISAKTIVTTPHGCFFMASDGIYLYNGSTVEKISQKIQPIIDNIWSFYKDRSRAVYHNNRYILSTPYYISGFQNSTIVIEYDVLTGNFTTRELAGQNVKDMIIFNDKVTMIVDTIVDSTDDDGLFYYENGDIMPYTWESGSLTSANANIEVDNIKLNTTGRGKVEITATNEKRSKVKILDIKKDGLINKSLSISGSQIKFKLKLLEGNVNIKKFDIEYELDEL